MLVDVKGHEGPLCGSCSADHGRRGLECRKCFAKGLVIFLLFVAFFWFLFVVKMGVQGNLSTMNYSRATRRNAVLDTEQGASTLGTGQDYDTQRQPSGFDNLWIFRWFPKTKSK